MNNIQKLMACTDVTRWHCINTARQQTLAEHQWAVAVLTAEIMRRSHYVGQIIDAAVLHALTHDLGEVDGGDPPNFDEPEQIKFRIRNLVEDKNYIALAVKLADLIDAAYFISNNFVGTRAERQAEVAYERFVKAVNYSDHGDAKAIEIQERAWNIWKELYDG